MPCDVNILVSFSALGVHTWTGWISELEQGVCSNLFMVHDLNQLVAEFRVHEPPFTNAEKYSGSWTESYLLFIGSHLDITTRVPPEHTRTITSGVHPCAVYPIYPLCGTFSVQNPLCGTFSSAEPTLWNLFRKISWYMNPWTWTHQKVQFMNFVNLNESCGSREVHMVQPREPEFLYCSRACSFMNRARKIWTPSAGESD